jgi:hypothetical protein
MKNPIQQTTKSGAARTIGPFPTASSFVGEPQEHGSHIVSAIYPSHAEAEEIRQRLIERGFAAGEVEILREAPHPPLGDGEGEHASDEVLTNMMVDGGIGTAVGTGVGAVGTAILWAANVTLFVASPVIAPLVMLGWFASVGGLLGAAAGAGAGHKSGKFSELVRDAIKSGNTVLIAHTHDEAERTLAKEIISHSLNGRNQVVAG